MNMMLILPASALVVALLGVALAQNMPGSPPLPASPKAEWSFEQDGVGRTPAGWRVAETNSTGKMGTWAVAADDMAPAKPRVLTLATQADDQTYNLLLAEKSSFKDLDLRVRIRADSGKEDQGGGPVWRCQDKNNYYICRINPLEGNFRVYKVDGGKRSQLASEELETKTGQWYEIRAVMAGDRIECHVDGTKYLEATDSTFQNAGMIGVWTKADASSSFDDVVVYAAPAAAPPDGDK
jgi:hypothetical protein